MELFSLYDLSFLHRLVLCSIIRPLLNSLSNLKNVSVRVYDIGIFTTLLTSELLIAPVFGNFQSLERM